MKTWIDERGADKKLTVLGKEALYVDDSDETDFSNAVEQLNNGAAPASVLSSKADQILLSSIYRVESEDTDTCVTVNYRNGKEDESEIYFYSTPKVRDSIVAELRNVLGERFQPYKDIYNVPRAIYASLVTLTLTVLISWILFNAAKAIQAAQEVEISGKNGFIKRLFVGALDLFGPTGVMILGWLVVIAILHNMYKRASNPPIMTIIQAEPYKGVSIARTAGKYLLLFGLIFITARAVAS